MDYRFKLPKKSHQSESIISLTCLLGLLMHSHFSNPNPPSETRPSHEPVTSCAYQYNQTTRYKRILSVAAMSVDKAGSRTTLHEANAAQCILRPIQYHVSSQLVIREAKPDEVHHVCSNDGNSGFVWPCSRSMGQSYCLNPPYSIMVR
jgi:hypothetical protein